jgi:hypothetical protein
MVTCLRLSNIPPIFSATQLESNRSRRNPNLVMASLPVDQKEDKEAKAEKIKGDSFIRFHLRKLSPYQPILPFEVYSFNFELFVVGKCFGRLKVGAFEMHIRCLIIFPLVPGVNSCFWLVNLLFHRATRKDLKTNVGIYCPNLCNTYQVLYCKGSIVSADFGIDHGLD